MRILWGPFEIHPSVVAGSSFVGRHRTPCLAVVLVQVTLEGLLFSEFMARLSKFWVKIGERLPVLRSDVPSFGVLSQPDVFVPGEVE